MCIGVIIRANVRSSGVISAGVCTAGRRPQGSPRTCRSDYNSHPAPEWLSVVLEELERLTEGRTVMTLVMTLLWPNDRLAGSVFNAWYSEYSPCYRVLDLIKGASALKLAALITDLLYSSWMMSPIHIYWQLNCNSWKNTFFHYPLDCFGHDFLMTLLVLCLLNSGWPVCGGTARAVVYCLR